MKTLYAAQIPVSIPRDLAFSSPFPPRPPPQTQSEGRVENPGIVEEKKKLIVEIGNCWKVPTELYFYSSVLLIRVEVLKGRKGGI